MNTMNTLLKEEFIGLATELWAAAQLLPEEGIEDGVDRIMCVLYEHFGAVLKRVLELGYRPVRPDEIGEGAQLIDGRWYMPLWDCDTVQNILDELKEERQKLCEEIKGARERREQAKPK